MKAFRLVLCLMFVVAMGPGCASFARHRLPDAGHVVRPADAAQPVSFSYAFRWRVAVGPAYDAPPQLREQAEKEFIDTLKESGYLMPLTAEQKQSIHIDAVMENYGSIGTAIAGGVIGGLSLTMIPVWGSDGYRATVTVTTAEGVVKNYVLDDAMTTVIWLPMIVAAPFKSPGRVSEVVRKNIYRTLVLRMQQDGILPR